MITCGYVPDRRVGKTSQSPNRPIRTSCCQQLQDAALVFRLHLAGHGVPGVERTVYLRLSALAHPGAKCSHQPNRRLAPQASLVCPLPARRPDGALGIGDAECLSDPGDHVFI
jgi:hypothetical protein